MRYQGFSLDVICILLSRKFTPNPHFSKFLNIE